MSQEHDDTFIDVDIEIFDSTDPRYADTQRHIAHSLNQLQRKADKIMADLTLLNEAVVELEGAEAAAAAEMRELVTDVENLTAGEVSQADIDAITNKATAVATALTEATTGAESAVKPPAPPEEPAAPTKPVYIHENVEAAVDPTLWVASGFQTTEETPRPLWYFTADTDGGEPTGAVEGEWTVYAGTVATVA